MIFLYLPRALYLIARDLVYSHGRRLAANLAHAVLWLVFLAPFTLAVPQASTYDIERRVAALERESERLRDRVNSQDVVNAARFASLDERTTSNSDDLRLVNGMLAGIGSLIIAGLCVRIFG